MRVLLAGLWLCGSVASASAQAPLTVSHADAYFQWDVPPYTVTEELNDAPESFVITCGALTATVPLPTDQHPVTVVRYPLVNMLPAPGTYQCDLYAQNSAGRQADPNVPFPLFTSGFVPGSPSQLSVLNEPPPPGSHEMGVIATDNFNRANETPLSGGGNWSLSFGDNPWDLSGNVVVPRVIFNDCVMHYTAGTWPNDQYSKADLTVTATVGGDQGVGLTVRGTTAATTYYRAVADHAASGNVSIAKMVAGVHTTLVSGTFSWTDGATWELRVQGTTLTFLCNGVTVLTTTDSSIASGTPGIALSSNVTSASIDNWEGGDFSSAAASLVYASKPLAAMLGR